MANNPKRIQDPTEAAMSAIQEALNLREEPAPPPVHAAEPAPPTAPDPFANMTAGLDIAAEYIAAQFRRAHLGGDRSRRRNRQGD